MDFDCLRRDTKILCYNHNYIPIQDLNPGVLVKTFSHGYKRIIKVEKRSLYNPGSTLRIKRRLYLLTKDNYPDIFEELYLTGSHSILVDDLTDVQIQKTIKDLKDVYVTENKYRLMTYLDERSEPYLKPGFYDVYHIILENEDYYMNYGIYANGLLVETASYRTLQTNMDISIDLSSNINNYSDLFFKLTG
jgi:hypothetical protein